MIWIYIACCGFLIAMILHAVLSRIAANTSRVALFVAIGTPIGAGIFYIAVTAYGLWSAKMLASVLVYAVLCELYIFVFTLAMASISANVLVRLKVKSLSVKDLSLIYDGNTMASRRVERLIDTELLAYDQDNILSLTAKGHKLAEIFVMARKLLHPTRSM